MHRASTRASFSFFTSSVLFVAGILIGSSLFFALRVNEAHASFAGDIDQGVFCFLDKFPTTDVFNTSCQSPTATSSTLTVIKDVVGGTAVSSDFSISVSEGSTLIADDPGSSAGTTYESLDSGAYTVSEDSGGPANYTPAYSGDCDASGDLTLVAGSSYECTVTNTYTAPPPATGVLVVKKMINGGSATPDEFSFAINGVATTTFNADGENDITEDVGTYAIAEVATSTYNASYSDSDDGDCSALAVTADATSTCTITNTFVLGGGTGGGPPPALSDIAVTKTVDNDTPNVGDTVTYTITVSDTGADATGVVVQDLLPAGVTFVSTSSADMVGEYASTTGDWTVGHVSSTTPAMLHIMATVNSASDGTVVTNTATVTSGDTSGDSDNDTGSASFTVTIPSGGSNSTPSSGGGGGGGGGGNGSPFIFGQQGGGGGGQVLGTSTENSSNESTCGPLLHTYMREGKTNDASEVEKLQTFLNNEIGSKLPVTGFFGSLTDAAVRKFQLLYGSNVLAPWVPYGLPSAQTSTGYVYKTTQREINNLYCSSLDLPIPTLP